MEPIEGSETSAFKPQTPGKYPKENILHELTDAYSKHTHRHYLTTSHLVTMLLESVETINTCYILLYIAV